jgi:hypothetical protein
MITRINRNKLLVKNGESSISPLYPTIFPVNPVFPVILSNLAYLSKHLQQIPGNRRDMFVQLLRT